MSMAALTLVIGNKNYSSWSMRPWVLMKQAGIEFDEVKLRFDSFETDSSFKREVLRVNPSGRVPVLIDGDLAVWDTLAIAEYLAETYPEKSLWPADRAARARARSVVAEMHSGFGALRSHFGMNIEASLPEVGERVLREYPEVEWACLVTGSRADHKQSESVALRIEPAFRKNLDEIAQKLREIGASRHATYDVLMLDTPEQMKQARQIGFPFYPWRK
jgi:glutathione S-transferase